MADSGRRRALFVFSKDLDSYSDVNLVSFVLQKLTYLKYDFAEDTANRLEKPVSNGSLPKGIRARLRHNGRVN